MQDINLNQTKLKVKVTYKKDQTLTTKFEAVIDEYLVNEAYLNTEVSKKEGHL